MLAGQRLTPLIRGDRLILRVPGEPIARGMVDRLNAASEAVADRVPGLTYVPFPTWRIGDMFIKQMFSWKTMHDAWGETLAAALRP